MAAGVEFERSHPPCVFGKLVLNAVSLGVRLLLSGVE